ncbi:MAG: hypothetical protein ACUVTP_03590 [Candidatus Fervidibacter sp.]|uniref:hypothetical protein n=1 Tax=Candidatus Fervidibacter sp. TaxID=3100871 RepID=UPI00404A76C3
MNRPWWHWVAWIVAFATGAFAFRLALEHYFSAADPFAQDVQSAIERHQISYIGDMTSQVFHRKSCPLANQIHPRFKVMFFSRRAALEMKFNPCPYCQP